MNAWWTSGLKPEQEERFRDSHLASDIAQARICVLLLTVPIVAFLLNDYRFFGSSRQFCALAALRLGLLVCTVVLLRYLASVRSHRSYDRAAFVWVLLLALSVVVIDATRPQNYLAHSMVVVVLVFVFALILPNKFANQVVLSSTVTLGEVAVILRAMLPTSNPAMIAVLLSLFLANVIAISGSWQLHSFRRRAFASGENERNVEDELRRSEERYHLLFNEMTEGFALHEIICDDSGAPCDYRFLDINPAFERLTGLTREEVVGTTHNALLPDDNPKWVHMYGQVALTGQSVHFDDYSPGLNRHYEVFAYSPAPRQFAAIFTDITQRKEAEQERDTTVEFLRLVNSSSGSREMVRVAAQFYQQQSGCEAVGIRLREGDDYPYWEARGFSDEFVMAENSLCVCDDAGDVVRDSNGCPVQACMCGNVICSRFDPSQPFFTEHGSFWTNCTTDLLASTSGADRQARTRNRCNGEGYESVALIPLRIGDDRLGLLQLNDRRKEMFTPRLIAMWERLGDQLAIALAKFQTDEALRESEERFRSVLDNSLDCIYRVNLQTGQYEYISPAAEEIVGCLPDELTALDVQTASIMIHPDDISVVLAVMTRLEATGQQIVEYRQQTKNGDYRWLSNRMHLTRDGAGFPLFRDGIIRDITDSKHGEEELRSLAQRLTSHMENSPLAVIEWDQDYRVIRWSEEAERVFGWTAEEIFGKRIDEMRWVYEEDWPIVVKLMEDMNAGIRPRNVNPNRNYRKDGSIIYCEWYNSVLKDESGNVASVLSLVLDVTEREQAEKELTAARLQAERRAGEIESFVSNLADGVSMLDMEGRVIWMNDAGKEILRVASDENISDWMLRFKAFSLDGKPLLPQERTGYRALRGERITDFRHIVVTPFGDSIALSVSASPVFDGEGRIIGATSSFRDQTERVAIEDEKQRLLVRERHITEVLQGTLVPQEIPEEQYGCRIAVKYQPALKEAEIGGDFFDVFDLGSGKLGVIIGDVAGKGLTAAVRVAEARYSVRCYAFEDPSPSRVLTRTNEVLCRNRFEESGMLTAFFAIVDTVSNTVTYSNAGHEPPLVIGADCSWKELMTTGMPLGIMAGVSYTEDSCDLRPGDRVVLITDGISEARAQGAVLFEKRGVIEYLVDNCETSPSSMIGGLLAAATEHAGGSLQDDAALVVFECGCRG